MPATTPAERKALLFIAFVAVLGTGARFAQAHRAEQARPSAGSVRALEQQLAVVDSVRSAGKREGGRGMNDLRTPRARTEAPVRARRAEPYVPLPPSPVPAAIDVDLASAAELELL